MTTYNGWANYATWRVMLECFDGYDTDERVTGALCREMTEDAIISTTPEGLGRDYAFAFLARVDWDEIADAVNENNDINDEDDTDA